MFCTYVRLHCIKELNNLKNVTKITSTQSAALSTTATQPAMLPEFGRKWGTECLNSGSHCLPCCVRDSAWSWNMFYKYAYKYWGRCSIDFKRDSYWLNSHSGIFIIFIFYRKKSNTQYLENKMVSGEQSFYPPVYEIMGEDKWKEKVKGFVLLVKASR